MATAKGPIPKRSAERRRRNKPEIAPKKVAVSGEVKIPAASKDWHPLAKRWYQSLKGSGQAQFYEPSDWAVAGIVAEVLSRNLQQGQRMSSQMFAAVMSTMGSLLTTEGDRRRVRLEIERQVSEPATVSVLDEYREAFN